MTAKYFKAIRFSVRLWYLLTIGGMAFVALGILMFYTLPELYLDLTWIFGFIFSISGFTEILFALLNRKELEGWGWLLAFGIFTLLIGILLFTHPQLTSATLPVFVGCGLLFRSVMAISISFELKNYGVKDWGRLLTVGILGAGFSLLLLLNPDLDDLSIVTWTGLAFITLGIYSIYFSLIIRRLHRILGNISTELKLKFHNIQQDIQEELMAEETTGT
jgi:uncharacterized membrane protein HdeD (DUF308 family)